MSWDAKDVALLKKLWAVGQSAAQIARRLGCSRNAVCAKLTRLSLKRGHKPPTAKPKIRPVPKRKPALLAACARSVAKKVSRKTVGRQPKEFTKSQLKAMLAEAAAKTSPADAVALPLALRALTAGKASFEVATNSARARVHASVRLGPAIFLCS